MKIQINIETKSDSEMNHMQYLVIANILDDMIKDIKNDPHKYLRVVDEFEKRDDDYGVVVTCVAMPGHDVFEDEPDPKPAPKRYYITKSTPCTRREFYQIIATSEDEAIRAVQDGEFEQADNVEVTDDDFWGNEADYSVEHIEEINEC